MQYKIYEEPFYDIVSMNFVKDIVSKKSLKDEMDGIIARRGSKHKTVVTKCFNNAMRLEKHIRKNINFNLPGYEKNGKQLAEFLYKARGEDRLHFVDALFYDNQNSKAGMGNKGYSILSQLADDFSDKLKVGPNSFNVSDTQFFSMVDECDVSDEIKLNAIRLYYNFEMYENYNSLLLSQTEKLIKEKLPVFENEILLLMKYVSSEVAKKGTEFFNEHINFSLDTKHSFSIYPGLYNINGITLRATDSSDIIVVIGLHIFTLIKTFGKMESADDRAEAFLKCLSDSTKLGILKLLKDGPMYGSQLAEKLNCTGANISHHMSSLLTLDLIYLKKENNRAYLHLNKEAIPRYLDDVKNLFTEAIRENVEDMKDLF